MLNVSDVTLKRGDDLLFEKLGFVVHPGHSVAVIGRNGVGKSTLFNLLLGRITSDEGEINIPAGWRIGYMEQEVASTQRCALDHVIDGDHALRKVEAQLDREHNPEHLAELHSRYDDLDGYTATARAGEILHGLGFSGDDFDQPYNDFSGGWRIRLNLARALMTPADLLLLDEPTNHLDLEAILWLENWLKRFPGTLLVIAHDRGFLDTCVSGVLHLSGRSGRLYRGNYTSFERQRTEALERELSIQDKRQRERARIQVFVDRFRAKASKAKQVQSRIKALAKLLDHAAIHVDSDYDVGFQNPVKTSNPLFSFRKLTLGYGDQAVLQDISQSILPGARIGVLGANGAGKSTLLKAIVGDLAPLAGELHKGQHADVGYFAQHQLEALDLTTTALATIAKQQPSKSLQQCRDYLGGWGFSAPMTERVTGSLSGGEKARLVLALIAATRPALLVLDEPTNHLDLDMRDALAIALGEYEGAVVIVAHDRTLLEKTVDEFWVLDNGSLMVYHGDMDDYTAQQTQRPGGAKSNSANADFTNRELRKQRAQSRESLRELKKNARALERSVDSYTVKLREVETRLADPQVYATLEANELNELLASAAKLRRMLESTEEAWLEAAQRLE